ncbi:MAG: hypothetical protein AAF675_02490 [Pseudomonadota bacterium]
MPITVFENEGADRKLADRDLQWDGIDRYDNFVAKAHDINEFHAQDQLRLTLQELELVDNETTVLDGGHLAYKMPLKFGMFDDEPSRFVSYKFYHSELPSRKPAIVKKLRRAFVLYFLHVAYSNLQFALDCVLNSVSGGRNLLRGALLMRAQLLGAPHLFLSEAATLELLARDLRGSPRATLVPRDETEAYLREHLVTPKKPFFEVAHGEAYIPLLALDALITAPRVALTELVPTLIAARDARGRRAVAREVMRRAPNGADSVASADSILRALSNA